MKNLLTMVLIVLVTGCATFNPTGPQSESEAFPLRNQDPQLGIVINEGTVNLNLYIYDQADRLVEQVYLAGTGQLLTINGRNIPRYWVRNLDFGMYRIEVFPFFYQTKIFPPGRYRVDLPKFSSGVWVDRNPSDYYDQSTGRHWGWIIRLNGGNIPRTASGLPGVKINLQGNFE
jgi:hypothetical protein